MKKITELYLKSLSSDEKGFDLVERIGRLGRPPKVAITFLLICPNVIEGEVKILRSIFRAFREFIRSELKKQELESLIGNDNYKKLLKLCEEERSEG